jgi:protein TonB
LSAITYSARPNRDRASPRRRAVSFALALAIEILLLLAFLTLDFTPEKKPEFQGSPLSTFDLAADEQQQATKSVQKQAAPTRPRPALPAPKIRLPTKPLQMIELTREEYLASDIAKLGTAAPDAGAALAQGSSPGDSQRVGTGPHGEPLYAAEWYREPTHQELSTYMPKTMPEGGGWGMVACRTAARFHVEDCVELGQAPEGSHLAGAVRQAAWQFLVRPPRVGGKPLVGEWVRIRITYSTGKLSDAAVQ